MMSLAHPDNLGASRAMSRTWISGNDRWAAVSKARKISVFDAFDGSPTTTIPRSNPCFLERTAALIADISYDRDLICTTRFR
jgi:hypothetical protein